VHCEKLQQQYHWNIQEVKQNLEQKGITENNAYLFMRGHDLLNKPILQIVKQATNLLVQQMYAEFNQIDKFAVRKTKIENYKNQQKRIKEALQEQTGFQEVIFYQKIIEDIQGAFEMKN
jgi:hypothetical protein